MSLIGNIPNGSVTFLYSYLDMNDKSEHRLKGGRREACSNLPTLFYLYGCVSMESKEVMPVG